VHKKSDADTIGDAEGEIHLAKSGKRIRGEATKLCIAKFKTIAEKGEDLKGSIPKLIAAIDTAILEFYPHEGPWDHEHRAELLNRYIAIMERIVNGDPVEIGEFEKVIELCRAIRRGFESHAKSHVHLRKARR
jgi:hypothetical protein